MRHGMAETTQQRRYRIGEVADRVGITARTIRYYEELGLLGAADARPKGGHRLYSDADIARLSELLRLRGLLGLSLEELTEIAEAADLQHCLRSRWAASTGDDERAEIIQTAIPHVERQLDLLRARRRGLAEFEAELTGKLRLMRRRLAELRSGAAAPGR